MPSSRFFEAYVGQTVTQIGSSQLLHSSGKNEIDVWGYSPFAACFTHDRQTPNGTLFSLLQATEHVLQPMHRRKSIRKPYRFFAKLDNLHLFEEKVRIIRMKPVPNESSG